jgi:hypothetical protein
MPKSSAKFFNTPAEESLPSILTLPDKGSFINMMTEEESQQSQDLMSTGVRILPSGSGIGIIPESGNTTIDPIQFFGQKPFIMIRQTLTTLLKQCFFQMPGARYCKPRKMLKLRGAMAPLQRK